MFFSKLKFLVFFFAIGWDDATGRSPGIGGLAGSLGDALTLSRITAFSRGCVLSGELAMGDAGRLGLGGVAGGSFSLAGVIGWGSFSSLVGDFKIDLVGGG